MASFCMGKIVNVVPPFPASGAMLAAQKHTLGDAKRQRPLKQCMLCAVQAITGFQRITEH